VRPRHHLHHRELSRRYIPSDLMPPRLNYSPVVNPRGETQKMPGAARFPPPGQLGFLGAQRCNILPPTRVRTTTLTESDGKLLPNTADGVMSRGT
jgi:hypothetical protein